MIWGFAAGLQQVLVPYSLEIIWIFTEQLQEEHKEHLHILLLRFAYCAHFPHLLHHLLSFHTCTHAHTWFLDLFRRRSYTILNACVSLLKIDSLLQLCAVSDSWVEHWEQCLYLIYYPLCFTNIFSSSAPSDEILLVLPVDDTDGNRRLTQGIGGSRRAVYSFPAASVTNYILDGLKQHNFIILQFWRSKN